MAEPSSEPVSSLYVHVPFCAQKCSYCAFFSEPSSGEVMDRYVGALTREMEMVAGELEPQTVFFGGGTPSLLNLRQWEHILRAMERLNLLGAVEWTVECNPATVSLDKARLWRDHGVNRLSMGVQSFNADLLDRLGRIHTREMAFKSYDILRKAGFDNLNLDLMFAIPGQTLEAWRETLTEAAAMASEHLSSYEVIYEEDTALYDQLKAGECDVDEDLACDMYDELVKRAAENGLCQYEVANFARSQASGVGRQETQKGARKTEDATRTPGSDNPPSPADAIHLPTHACRHNVNYWRGGSFYGLGPSATSYVRGVRAKNWANTTLYCEQLEGGRRAIESQEELTPLARAGETAAFGLRMVMGWPFEQFRQVTGFDLREHWAEDMNQVVRQGWGVLSADSFHLTPQGLRFADTAAQLFLRPETD